MRLWHLLCRSDRGDGKSNGASDELSSRDHLSTVNEGWRRTPNLEQEWHETPRPIYILLIGLSEGRGEHGFLEWYAIRIGQPQAQETCSKSRPISESQTKSEKSQESATIGRMTDVAIGACLYQGVTTLDRHVKRKIFPQYIYGVPAKNDSRQHQTDADKEERRAFPRYCSLRQEEREQEVQGYSKPPKDCYETERALIASFCRIARSLDSPGDEFQQYPQRKCAPKNQSVH